MSVTFLWEDISARQTARFTPRLRLPQALPAKMHGTQGHPMADAPAIIMTLNVDMSDGIWRMLSVLNMRAHDPLSFSCSDGSARKVDGSPSPKPSAPSPKISRATRRESLEEERLTRTAHCWPWSGKA